MTTQQAWQEFWSLIHNNGVWDTLTREDKINLSSVNYLATKGGVNQKGSPKRLTAKRAFAIFEKYAPGAFRVVQPEVYFERV